MYNLLITSNIPSKMVSYSKNDAASEVSNITFGVVIAYYTTHYTLRFIHALIYCTNPIINL